MIDLLLIHLTWMFLVFRGEANNLTIESQGCTKPALSHWGYAPHALESNKLVGNVRRVKSPYTNYVGLMNQFVLRLSGPRLRLKKAHWPTAKATSL